MDRYLRLELDERTTYRGVVQKPVDLSPLSAQLDYLKAEGVEAIAISFLHAYLNSENEQAVITEINKLWPEVSVLASSEISREWREYERTNTTVLSAYVHPIAQKYIESLESKLAGEGFTEPPYMMQSNGGIATVQSAKGNPISMVESGPASGIFAAAYMGNMIGEKNLVVLDIGGKQERHHMCTSVAIEQGEVVRLMTGTGGGYGNPLKRSKEKVMEDIKNGYIAKEQALNFYHMDEI